MAVAALRIAVGHLPPGSGDALAAALRPTHRRQAATCTQPHSNAAVALRVAACWLPPGNSAAAAIAAVSGQARLEANARRCCQKPQLANVVGAPTDASSSSNVSKAALAVAARKQPNGSLAAVAMAAAAGPAFANAKGGDLRRQRIAGSALAVAASRLSSDIAASLLIVSKLPQSRDKAPAASRPQSWLASASIREGVSSSGQSDTVSQGEYGLPHLCQDTSRQVMSQLWPALGAQHSVRGESSRSGVGVNGTSAGLQVSPRTFETRLRQSRPILSDLGRVAAVSSMWARQTDKCGWPSTHAYLFQMPGTKVDLQKRYGHSMRKLLVKDWVQQTFPSSQAARHIVQEGTSDGVVNHIAAFMP